MLPNPSSNLQVSAGTGMSVVVSPGFAIVNGCLKLEETQRTLAIQTPGATYDRIDTVVMRLDDNDNARNCDLYVLEGTPALSPVRPELTRTGSVWEIGLADIFVAKNTAAVSNQRITDTRYETSRCGVISSISRFDTTTIYQQVQSDLAEFKESEQAEFMEWFTNLQSQLDENAAANLQNQIGTLASLKTTVKTNLVNALNWLTDKIGGTDISGIGDGTMSGAISEIHGTIQKVVWEASNYTSSSTITLSDTDWDYIEVFTYYDTSKDQVYSKSLFPGTKAVLFLITNSGTDLESISRVVAVDSDKKVVTLSSSIFHVQGNTPVEAPNRLLPFKIIGHKYIKD